MQSTRVSSSPPLATVAQACLLLLLPVVAPAQPERISWNNYFQPEQAEILMGQAREVLADNRFGEAEVLLDQALQVNRASRGLHNPSQLAVLEQLLETLLLQQKWDEFDRRLDYISWLNERINAQDPDRLAEVLLRQSDWHRAAAGVNQRSQSAWYLIQGKYLNWQAISVLESRYGKTDPRLAPILYQIALEHYYQSVLIERRGTSSYEFKTEGKAIANGWVFSRNESVQRSYRIGRENLQRIRAIYSSAGYASDAQHTRGAHGVTDALLQIHQADWEFVHGNNRIALELYREAWFALLAAGIDEAEVERFFNQRQLIPAQSLQVDWQSPVAEDNESSVRISAWSILYPGAESPSEFLQPPFRLVEVAAPQVRAQLRLEITGDSTAGDFDYSVTGIDILESIPEDESVINRAFAELPLLKFRPRLVAGELASHEPFLLDYRFAIE